MTRPPQINRVLMTADTVGGVWTYALDLCRGLTAQGVRVILATMGAPLQPQQRADLAKIGPGVDLHESGFRLEWMDDPWSDVAAAGEWLLGLERDYRPDLIHLNGYAHAALSWHAPVLVVAHSCVLSWWRAVRGSEPPAVWSQYRAAVQAGLRRADLVVAPTQAMLASLQENYGRVGRARVIHNGRDPLSADDRQPSKPANARSNHFIPAKFPVVLSVGRLWDEAKNARALASVAHHLPWRVRLAGDTRSPHGKEAALAGVDLLGHRSPRELADEYRRADIYALPARYEPFGLSILEAAHAGCALVLGDIASLRELWTGAAVFVPPDDTFALRAALLDLIQNPYRRRVLGEHARQRARHYGAARMTAAYVSLYAELLARAHRPARGLAASLA